MSENIILDYPVRIMREGEMFRARAGCEFFVDEHGFQWVKYVPDNTYLAGHEHLVRADKVIIVREDMPRRGSVRIGAPIGATIGEGRPA